MRFCVPLFSYHVHPSSWRAGAGARQTQPFFFTLRAGESANRVEEEEAAAAKEVDAIRSPLWTQRGPFKLHAWRRVRGAAGETGDGPVGKS